MAIKFNDKSTELIFNEILSEKESGKYPELDGLNSTSKVSIYRLMLWIFAFFTKTIQELFESFKNYIENVFAKNQHGTLLWWIEQVKEFQFGDILIFKDGVFKYENVVETKRIVKRVALETLNFVLVFKVATENDSGNLIPLDTSQQEALTSYINKVKFPGTYIFVLSADADDLKINLRIYYNAEITKSELEALIQNTTEGYVKNIIFNAEFSITEYTDVLQKVKGVVNPVVRECFIKVSGSPTSNYQLIEDYGSADAGYFKIQELNIQYISHV